MIESIVTELGPWSWWVVGLLFLGIEILLPGIFFLWIGVAAMIVGAISFALWDSAIWPWQLQITVFAILSVVSGYAGKKYIGDRQRESDEPLLNQRTEALVGRIATLEEPIENGRGRIKLDDTLWVIEGPELKSGEKIQVISASSNRLKVAQA
ncbi:MULTISPECIES: NfeD family protein [unclassified Lentilitoribacter]|jgi:membrane protein implicated in regulation of membrane protease activity|uniref:NfeD family protein n=1 Tax=unclassified Lentilitoribacter TaxID=2647570 RepID=UPI0013A6C486|nr:NfeD family protein [Lentilitoribacter sp. Alg239-R112]